MNRRFITAIAASIAVTAAATPASAVVITFENAGAVGQVMGNNIVDSGFRISADQCARTSCFQVREAPRAGTGSAGKVLEGFAFNPAITIAQVGGGAFTLQSFALTGVELPSAFQSNFDVLFGFNYADGTRAVLATSVDANFSTPTSYLIRDQLAGFTDKALSSFFVKADFSSQAGAKLQLDNINVTPLAAAVPEPATWAMMIGGFGMIGAAFRRRRVTARFA